MHRRRLLALSGGVVSLAVGGLSATALSDDPVQAPDLYRYELGRATDLPVEGSADRRFEISDDGRWVEVQYTSGTRTVAFEEWAPGVAASVASRAVERELGKRIPTQDLTIGHGSVDEERFNDEDRSRDEEQSSDGDRFSDDVQDLDSFDETVGPRVTWPVTVEGLEEAGAPEPPFDDLVDATPRAVDVIVDFDGHEYAGLLPVVCQAIRREQY